MLQAKHHAPLRSTRRATVDSAEAQISANLLDCLVKALLDVHSRRDLGVQAWWTHIPPLDQVEQ